MTDIFDGSNTDRRVHAWGQSGEVVRYDKAGKWYWEPKQTVSGHPPRVKLTLQEAVDKGMWCWYDDAGTVCLDRPGGGAFDRSVRARHHVD